MYLNKYNISFNRFGLRVSVHLNYVWIIFCSCLYLQGQPYSTGNPNICFFSNSQLTTGLAQMSDYDTLLTYWTPLVDAWIGIKTKWHPAASNPTHATSHYEWLERFSYRVQTYVKGWVGDYDWLRFVWTQNSVSFKLVFHSQTWWINSNRSSEMKRNNMRVCVCVWGRIMRVLGFKKGSVG